MFVDELTIEAKAGDGGNGVVRWLRERYRPMGGPAGGNGGKGGDVYLRGAKNLAQLSKYTGEKRFSAQNGEHGGSRSTHGVGGEDCYIDIPVGSTVHDLKRDRTYQINSVGETMCILKGGKGGFGNEHFKSSTNRSPEEFTDGAKGETGTFCIEVALIVDIGLIGKPNAGKSTLLNTLTNAKSAVGAYPFTTLEPHLGDHYGILIADIPGLIEGASSGKGLGHKFLKHVRRTKMLFHVVSLTEDDPFKTYMNIREELKAFDESLLEKEEWIILSKSSLVSDDVVARVQSSFKELNKPTFIISALEKEGTEELTKAFVAHISEDS